MKLGRDSGVVLGGIALAAATTAYHALCFGAALSDGQYGMVWMFTLPAGAALGWATERSFDTRASLSERARACFLGSLLVLVPVALYLLQATSNAHAVASTPVAEALVENVLFSLPTIACIGALVARGVTLRLSKA